MFGNDIKRSFDKIFSRIVQNVYLKKYLCTQTAELIKLNSSGRKEGFQIRAAIHQLNNIKGLSRQIHMYIALLTAIHGVLYLNLPWFRSIQ